MLSTLADSGTPNFPCAREAEQYSYDNVTVKCRTARDTHTDTKVIFHSCSLVFSSLFLLCAYQESVLLEFVVINCKENYKNYQEVDIEAILPSQ